MTVPTEAEINVAWIRLPQAERDRLGFIAVNMVFAEFVGGDAMTVNDQIEDYAVLDENVRHQAMEAENQLTPEIEAALPELFGPPGENPAWSENAGPTPTPAALAYARAYREDRADYKRRERSSRIRLGRRGLYAHCRQGGVVIAEKGTGIPKTDSLELNTAEAWLAERGGP